MQDKAYQAIASAPLFHELVRKRNRFSLILTLAMLAIYYAFVLFTAMDPKGFATTLGDDTYVSVGLLAGWAVQLIAFLLTGVYVRRANVEFDQMNKAILTEATR